MTNINVEETETPLSSKLCKMAAQTHTHTHRFKAKLNIAAEFRKLQQQL